MASYCKKCRAPIVWIKTPDNRWMPCDEGLVEYRAGSTPDFEDYVVNDNGEVIQCTFDFLGDPDGLARFPHWKSCPYADEFREQRSLWRN